MTIHHQVLGNPGRDNALYVRVDSGQSIDRLLFDCGDGCLTDLTFSEIQAIDQLFFSHLHMDHIGGFDSFFRCTFNRDTKPNVIWGPPGTSAILQHRFCGFWWNLHEDQPGTWWVNDIHSDHIQRYRFDISEAFQQRHNEGASSYEDVIVDDKNYTVRAIQLEHNGPCLGYLVTEKPRLNVDTERLSSLGLRPGPWMRELKSDTSISSIEIEGATFDLAKLRSDLLIETPGDSMAYLTDFLLDDDTCTRLEKWLGGCNTVICEAQYCHSDIELARRNYHTTTKLVSQLAARAGIGKLVLFHLSSRYTSDEWASMLSECREAFPSTVFPDNWCIGPQAECGNVPIQARKASE